MAKAKRKKKNTAFWTHEYTVAKADPGYRRVEEVKVVGSREATAKQERFEDEGFFVVVTNNTTGEEEYRTPGYEDE